MRESLKTIILLLLVATSIVLTGLLLFGQPTLETAAPPAYEQLVFGELRPVSEHILPELRLRQEDEWQLLFPWNYGHNSAWGLFLDLVRFGGTPAAASPPAETQGVAAYAHFSSPVHMGLWLPSARSVGLNVAGLAWYAAEPQKIWYVDEEGQWYASALSFLPDGWQGQLHAAFVHGTPCLAVPAQDWEPLSVQEERRIFIPRETPGLLPYSLRKEELDTEKVVRSIFVNTSLVRRIEERGGAVIVTDGQRGLRLFDHGEIEYTSPKSEPGLETLELEQVLRRVAQYLQLMGGWAEHLYLDSFDLGQTGQPGIYSFSFFSVQNGIRLESAKPTLKLRFSDRGVIDYNRQVVTLDKPAGPERKLIDPREAAEEVAGHMEQKGRQVNLDGVYPALYTGRWPGRDVAQPVWVFLFSDGRKVVVHGYSGQIMAMPE